MKQSQKDLLHEGYILIPKALLRHQVNGQTSEKLKAFLQILIRANYSETTYRIQTVDIVCHRGESAISLRRWSELFQWSRTKAIRFFQEIEKKGLIRIIPQPRNIFHIQIVNYDFWTGTLSPEAREESKKRESESFHVFWDRYHETVQKPKLNVARARREWDKLTPQEQQLAIDHIEEFYYHTNDTRFIPLASTYLKDKAFLNEYTD